MTGAPDRDQGGVHLLVEIIAAGGVTARVMPSPLKHSEQALE